MSNSKIFLDGVRVPLYLDEKENPSINSNSYAYWALDDTFGSSNTIKQAREKISKYFNDNTVYLNACIKKIEDKYFIYFPYD